MKTITITSLSLILLGFTLSCTDTTNSTDEPDPGSGQKLIISGISPDEGPAGTEVSISGQGFGTNQSDVTVTFDGTEAEIQSLTSNRIEVIVPDETETGTVIVSVGRETAEGPVFTVLPPPMAIESITPESGRPGTEVEIHGENFEQYESELQVYFNGLLASITDFSDTLITTSVPEGASTGPIELEAGSERITGPVFTVPEAPQFYTVNGRVTEGDTDFGVDGVELLFSDGTTSVTTDQNGYWSAELSESPAAVSVQSDAWEFDIHTRLVLAEEDEVNFRAFQQYEASSGNHLAYQFREGCSGGTSCDKPYSIWTAMTNGLYKEKITDDEGSDEHPAWSPDAARIAFSSNREDGESYQIWLMDNDGSSMENTGVEGREPDWSPGGSQIVYSFEGNIYKMDLNGSAELLYQSNNSYASSPKWSPDGSKIAFDINDYSLSETHIWVMESNGENLTQLTDDGGSNRSPAWEPSGGGILMGSIVSSVPRLQLMDVDGKNIRQHENWPNHAQASPAWSPTGGSILYVSRRMIPISDQIRRMPANPESVYSWSNIVPGNDDAEDEFWALSPAWAPEQI
ncbi:IPT/TIG domain-containing protein [Rhodohalobacter halophilus]|uniref:IPT/TIG domain-containing protein n=1 Tax=Rhodohalobacter halophilus TaxID=1812810 RepID=UPI00083F5F2E|nr:IPT/TIG domain-containing protein [Rhodohalobacter halophilus]